MIVLSIILGGIVISLFALHWYQTQSRFAKLLNAFPGFSFIPIVGDVIRFPAARDELFKTFFSYGKNFPASFRLWSFYVGSININNAEDAEIVLSSMKLIDKGLLYTFLSPWLGTGLLTSTGQKWQQRRKILTPTFHFNILQKFVEVFSEHCTKLLDKLKEEAKKPQTDVVPIMTKFTLNSICETAMGTKIDEKNEGQRNYVKSVYEVGHLIITRCKSPWLYTEGLFALSLTNWRQKKHLNVLHNFTDNVIREREKSFNTEDVEHLQNNNEEKITKKKRFAMLDLLLYAKNVHKEIDYLGIREEVDTFMFEGHDTTAMAISHTLLALANHQDAQEKCILELDEIFGDSDRPLTYEDLQKMKYIELCIKESLRLYPSVPIISRKMSEETRLTHNTAPAGCIVLLYIHAIHRNPKYYNDPDKFDPERFLPENSRGRHPYAYIPFSAGPRNCIGQKYAILELKSIVSTVLRNYRMEPVDTPEELVFVADIVLRPKGAIYVKFVPRTGTNKN